jgi:hypothetical protein
VPGEEDKEDWKSTLEMLNYRIAELNKENTDLRNIIFRMIAVGQEVKMYHEED